MIRFVQKDRLGFGKWAGVKVNVKVLKIYIKYLRLQVLGCEAPAGRTPVITWLALAIGLTFFSVWSLITGRGGGGYANWQESLINQEPML